MNESAREKLKSNQKTETADRLHSAAIHLLRRLRPKDEASGIGPAKLSALSILVFAGPRSIGELAKMEQVRAPTMTRIIDGLEAEGFIIRKIDKEDRRSLQIQATAKGIKLLQDARKRRLDELVERLEGTSPKDLALLLKASIIIEKILR